MYPSRSEQANHPVMRTLYGHTEEVTCVEFHPKELILVSGSKDKTVKMFDVSKQWHRRAFKTIHQMNFITRISFDPSGKDLVIGTEHPGMRVYDVKTQTLIDMDF